MASRTKPSDLAKDILSAIEVNAELAAYVSTHFSGHTLATYDTVDMSDQPDSTTYPHICVQRGSYVPDRDRTGRNITLAFSIVIEKSGKTTSGSRTTLSGSTLLEGMYFVVERIIESFITNRYNGNYAADWADSRTEIAYPLFRITFEITFQGDY